MKTLSEKISEIDDGRFKKLCDALEITKECAKCQYFAYYENDSYMCAVTPQCIGATLSFEVKSYILWKLDFITEQEHRNNLGI